jgi:predicted branched-subunit amino acid permease
LLSITNGMNGGALFTTIAESFSRRHRAAGMSLVYAFGVALFGGASQFVVTALINATGITAIPWLYMLVTGTLAFVALLAVFKTKEQNGLASAKAIWR